MLFVYVCAVLVGALLLVDVVLGLDFGRPPEWVVNGLSFDFGKYLRGSATPRRALNLTLAVFALTFVISTFWSIDKHTSIWGYYTRFNGGLMSMVAYFVIFCGIKYSFSKSDYPILINITLFSSFIVSVYGIGQKLFSLGAEPITRVYSTLGQPNWTAQFLAITACISLAVYFASKTREHLVIFAVNTLCVILTYSMSGFVGLGVGLIYVLFTLPSSKNSKKIVGWSVVILTVAFSVVFRHRLYDAAGDLKTILGKQLLTNQVHKISDPLFIRYGMWQGSILLATSSTKIIAVGTGPETFVYAFQKFRPPVLNYSSEWDYVLNKPHNYYLEILVEQGIVSLILYLVLLAILFKGSPTILKSGLLVFVVTNIFGWPVVATELVFILLLSYVNKFGGEPRACPTADASALADICRRQMNLHSPTGVRPRDSTKFIRGLFLLFIFVFVVKAIEIVGFIFVADYYFNESYNKLVLGQNSQAYDLMNKAIELNPKIPSYFLRRALVQAIILQEDTSMLPEYREVLTKSALQNITFGLSLNRSNLVTIKEAVPVYYLLSISSSTVQKETLDFYTQVKNAYRTDAGLITLVAGYERKLALEENYAQSKKFINYLRPDLLNWHQAFN